MNGVQMAWLHPEVPSCADCQRFLYRDDWTLTTRLGKPEARPPGSPTPCWKCPKKSPENEADYVLSPRNRKALEHFLATRFGGLTPQEAADPIVRRNRSLLEQLLMSINREQAKLQAGMVAMLAVLGNRGAP